MEQVSTNWPVSGTQEAAQRQADKFSEAGRAHRRKRRKRKGWRGIPAPPVFYFLFALGLASAAVVYVLKDPFLPFPLAVCAVTAYALYVNDHKGFVRRKQMQRAREARRNFNNGEILLLLGSIVMNLFVAAYVFVT